MDEQEKGLRGGAGHQETSNENNISPDEGRVNHSGGFFDGMVVTKKRAMPTEPQDEHDANGFMSWVFGTLDGEVAATGFPSPNGGYAAMRWNGQFLDPRATHFSMALFDPQLGARRFYRRSEFFTGSIGVVLDDIIEKAAPPDLPPTYRMLTKPGSEQRGYLFNEPCRKPSVVCGLLTSVSAAGIGDRGGNNLVRLARLPGSLPEGKQHRAKLLDWSGPRYDAETLREQLGIAEVLMPPSGAARPVDADCLSTDPVLSWLYEKGLILGQSGHDYRILCPWQANHTGGDPSGTAYKPPSVSDARRQFHCFHSCPHGTRDFLMWVADEGGPRVGPVDEKAILNMRRKGGEQ